MQENLLTAEEVADLLQVSRYRFYQLVRNGIIPGVIRLGRQLRIDRSKLREFCDNGGK